MNEQKTKLVEEEMEQVKEMDKEVGKVLPNDPDRTVELPRGLNRRQALELFNNASCGD